MHRVERAVRFSRRIGVLLAAAAAIVPFATARAQAPQPFIIGVSGDQSGPYIDVTGPGQVLAAELAVADFGGQVLGRPIVIRSADDQNRPDIASANARRWFDVDRAEVIVGGGNSTTAFAVLNAARQAGRSFLVVGAGNPDFAGKECSAVSTQWAYDTHAQAVATGVYLSRGVGVGSWFFITADYAFGHALERDTGRVVAAAGGRVAGSVRAPLGTADFSSFLLQAQGSRAGVIALALAGQDLINAIKQAGEFGLVGGAGGQRLAGLSLLSNDVVGIGLAAAEGLVASESFYWDRTEETRAWTRRFNARLPGKIPNMVHAATYSAVLHYLRAVQAAGTVEARTVNAKMKELPVNDFNNADVRIRQDGRVLNPMYILRVKSPRASTGPFDVQEVLATLPAEQVFRTAEEAGCRLSN
ncbi:ABC transporter substrate-binding protein [Phreatobacter stygius]|uniref:ABC transporter substrate-binding protein n=1 Tax=Phreatobacter stygius TaxID=1940610 RepID=A0A4D7B5M3_9HYPH|nr:ABC transporter substrate-binding protein [Phreatobacter stygius]QCI66283.1 ABC transporter substrate-binding protein [Phreatobacter stygius]